MDSIVSTSDKNGDYQEVTCKILKQSSELEQTVRTDMISPTTPMAPFTNMNPGMEK